MATRKNKKVADLEDIIDKYNDVCATARMRCEDFLKWALKKYGQKSVNDEGTTRYTLEFDVNSYEENTSIMYDGGNHPEYASDCFATVFGVYMEDGEISFNIAECCDYDIDNTTTEDLLSVCSTIKDGVIPRIVAES